MGLIFLVLFFYPLVLLMHWKWVLLPLLVRLSIYIGLYLDGREHFVYILLIFFLNANSLSKDSLCLLVNQLINTCSHPMDLNCFVVSIGSPAPLTPPEWVIYI